MSVIYSAMYRKKKKRKKRWVDGQIEEWMCDRTSKTSVEECKMMNKPWKEKKRC